MGDQTFRDRAMVPGAVRDAGPVLACTRFWTQGWRFHGRASRSEFLWPLVPELVLVVLLVGLPIWRGVPWRWDAYGDPFGIVPSPAVHFSLFGDPARGVEFGFGSGARVAPNPWDVAMIVGLALTALPRWTLLVRRLHDRDHGGLWVLLLVLTGPLGWLVLGVMVLRGPRPGGARFDPSLADAYLSGLRTPRSKRQV